MSYGYGGPPQSGGTGYNASYSGAPQSGYGPPQGGPPGGYGGGGYGGGYGAPTGGYGAQTGGYGAQTGGYGAQGGGYGAQGGYGGAQTYGGGGFGAAARPPPPGADPEVWELFTRVDRNSSGVVTAFELQSVLLNDSTDRQSQFDIDTIKLLMSIFDVQRNGTIDFTEFVGLYKYIKDWLGVFSFFDQDRSGTIDGRELRKALERFGYTGFSPQLIDLLEKKYSSTNPRHGPPGISFDHFICACVHIKQLTDAFRRLDTDNDGVIQINYDSFMHTALSST